MRTLQIAGGSVPGKSHRHSGRNNQDAYTTRASGTMTAAVVADGCGSGANSEYGAQLGVLSLAGTLAKTQESQDPLSSEFWKQIAAQCKHDMFQACPLGAMEETYKNELVIPTQFLLSHLLHTLVGVFVFNGIAYFFSYGDGVFVINGEVTTLGPFKNNAPPYIAYELDPVGFPRSDLGFKIHRAIPLDELDWFIIGTDGCEDLFKVLKPEELVGNDVVFRNADKVRRLLWQHRDELSDDTTLIVGRTTPSEDSNAEHLS